MTEHMTLGKLIDALAAIDPERELRFDFGYFVPGDVASYRGHNHQLAIEYRDLPAKTTVGALLATLRAADGTIFEGYKGGNYRMGRDTLVWAAKWGEAPVDGDRRRLRRQMARRAADRVH